ncbi:MAG: DUF1343 domain-containing protein [Bacteroidales bacterium]|nr:DUF1343 domain-containing protein [Bacteroidales bacterium]
MRTRLLSIISILVMTLLFSPAGNMKGQSVTTGLEVLINSQFAIPYVHGMTVGELALFLNVEGLLKNVEKCKLEVVKMKGWKRDMSFEQTGLPCGFPGT